jgi:Rps23 Pro-64 3,4-dihydroxylase Tpa1-like proline 4-hydroxylase
VLFNVGPDTSHFVTTVSPYAQGKRLTINGWWTGSDPIESSGDRASERIDDNVSIEIY